MIISNGQQLSRDHYTVVRHGGIDYRAEHCVVRTASIGYGLSYDDDFTFQLWLESASGKLAVGGHPMSSLPLILAAVGADRWEDITDRPVLALFEDGDGHCVGLANPADPQQLVVFRDVVRAERKLAARLHPAAGLQDIDRITVVGDTGRKYEGWDLFDRGCQLLVQDDGRTLKVLPRTKGALI